ncbi:MAG: transporter substrate-binding domain-containing protein [Lachnospiraceae bacterium]|nr:transporter substrate-binding domain-containing protein [Lachnospiraceae bacterium]
MSGCGAGSTAEGNTVSVAGNTTESTGAGSESTEAGAEGSDEAAAADTTEKRVIVAATSAAPRPFAYYDEENNLTGQNIELVNAIFERLPQYELKWEVTDFASIFTGIDAGRYQIGVNNISKNPEREEKYLYSDPMFSNSLVIITNKDSELSGETLTFADLAGHTYIGDPNIKYTTDIQNWNDAHPDQEIGIVYSEEDLSKQLQGLQDGGADYDFLTIDKPMYDGYYQPEFGFDLKEIPLVADPDEDLDSYFIFSKTDTQLAEDVNKALKEVIEDGTSKEISVKFLGDDFSPAY